MGGGNKFLATGCALKSHGAPKGDSELVEAIRKMFVNNPTKSLKQASLEVHNSITFEHDEAPPHWILHITELLNMTFSTGGDGRLVC
ncbi:hypothetical protein NPIL_592211 [Nephila pilipes]|uniref:Uncharacterized protein n=1 Tax=Nephila pilipes TaxID=299642 RepID=A0A8X6MTW8_NEPPI|nr:hypothetical protein NPIL_592211 [Nephila pilipes]